MLHQVIKPRLGAFQTAAGGFAPVGGSLKFSKTIMNGAAFGGAVFRRKRSAGSYRPDSLIYILPREGGDAAAGGGQVVMNLLLQLRAYVHQTNFILQNRGMERQLTRQLQMLSAAVPAVRETVRQTENGRRQNGRADGGREQALHTALTSMSETLKKKTFMIR